MCVIVIARRHKKIYINSPEDLRLNLVFQQQCGMTSLAISYHLQLEALQ